MRELAFRQSVQDSPHAVVKGLSRFSNRRHRVRCFNPGGRSFPADSVHVAMNISPALIGAAICAALAANVAEAASPDAAKETALDVLTVTGPFEVRLSPQPPTDAASQAGLGRMTLDKKFHGPLEAVSAGEMLAFRSAVAGSAGYVAMETVRGTLAGRAGSFVLQHSSTMNRGVPTQSITVVPDSGTGALAGLAGRMSIDIGPDGAHSYRFEYTLQAPGH